MSLCWLGPGVSGEAGCREGLGATFSGGAGPGVWVDGRWPLLTSGTSWGSWRCLPWGPNAGWWKGRALGTADHWRLSCISTVRQVRLVRGLQAVEVREQGTATMEVELSHAEVEGTWTRDGLRLQPGPRCHVAAHGATHILTLSELQPQDSGLVAFKAEGVHTSARLVVTGEWVEVAGPTPERPASFPKVAWEAMGTLRTRMCDLRQLELPITCLESTF